MTERKTVYPFLSRMLNSTMHRIFQVIVLTGHILQQFLPPRRTMQPTHCLSAEQIFPLRWVSLFPYDRYIMHRHQTSFADTTNQDFRNHTAKRIIPVEGGHHVGVRFYSGIILIEHHRHSVKFTGKLTKFIDTLDIDRNKFRFHNAARAFAQLLKRLCNRTAQNKTEWNRKNCKQNVDK